MKIIKLLLFILGGILILFAAVLGYLSLTDYNPPEVETLYRSANPDTITVTAPVRCLSWNIGYGGLGSDMDFFYDGGKQVRTSKERTITNLDKISKFLQANDTMDFIFLQEVDNNAQRTYHRDEFRQFSEALSIYKPFFAMNYNSKFVPVPPTHPMGMVKSGLATYSRYIPSVVQRINFPGDPSWPVVLFELDRCFMVCRFPLSNGKELVVLNSHNSAFDNGSLKTQEMSYLKNFVENEYSLGNYVLVGADWNQNPPGFDPNSFGVPSSTGRFRLFSIKPDYLDTGWTFAYDPSTPSNRDLLAPYNSETTFTTILDFYLSSPNMVNTWVKTIDLNFENSDHNPVIASFHYSPTP
jgi:endonuclease/exonuclease/phosphatase family metal-dependent hydrolase